MIKMTERPYKGINLGNAVRAQTDNDLLVHNGRFIPYLGI